MTLIFWLCAASVVLAVIQEIPMLLFVRMLRRESRQPLQDFHRPRFAVLMPLRGNDPHLQRAIHGVLSQDYPDFELRIIVDHADDPAWDAVNAILDGESARNVRVSTLNRKYPTCSLICSACVQFLDELDDSDELIAFCPADSLVPSTWLRDMAAILDDPKVGATLGNRWYAPGNGMWGSLVRYVWNLGAIVPMWLYGIPWGGALAMRRRDVERADLRSIWSRSMCEDVSAVRALKRLGLQLRFSPRLIITNEEDIGLQACTRFISRQLFLTRFHLPRQWFLGTLHFLPTAVGLLLPLIALYLVQGSLADVSLCLSAIAISSACLAVGAVMLETSIRKLERKGNTEPSGFSMKCGWRLFVAMPLAMFVYSLATIQSMCLKKVEWRGVVYNVKGRDDIEMVKYSPYLPPQDQPSAVDMSI